jgi:hypothetical protein
VKKHRQQVLPYLNSRRLIDSKDLDVIISAKDYYNSVRKEIPDKSKPKIIITLLRMLDENGFIYRTRVSIEEDESGTVVTRKLDENGFIYRTRVSVEEDEFGTVITRKLV